MEKRDPNGGPNGEAAGLLDLERYAIDRPESEDCAALVERCRAALADDGACVLEGFVRAERLPGLVAELEPALDRAHFVPKSHNPYLVADDPDLPAEHPRNRKQRTSSATLACDLIPEGGALRALYDWPPFVAFVARVQGHPALYPYADPLSPLNVLVYRDGAETGWHFDIASFVVTLLLQAAEAGGGFDYAPFIRGAGGAGGEEDDERYDRVAEVLDGRSERVLELRQSPGALVLFRGSRTLHRVTPVAGPRPRLIGVFSYAPEPGRALDPHTRQTFYGRVG